MELLQGNEACARAAMDAGCNFYAGYPITPASEIMEWMARKLPAKNGQFIQMEDEIGSLAAVIGAAWAGSKAMTATSGPGFSLMQENIGYAAMTETPCVIVNSQRGGPSTGLPTLPAQGDVMQSKWGSHGDRPAITLTASSVLDTYEMTIAAFNHSEQLRVPVVLLLDATISHLRENVTLPQIEIKNRQSTAENESIIFGTPYFSKFGEGPRKIVTGLVHDDTGHPKASQGDIGERLLKRSIDRIEENVEEITYYKEYKTGDATWLIITYGITARPAKEAVDLLRREHVKAGLLNLQTLWPCPGGLIRKFASNMEGVLVPELNLGQYDMPVKAALEGKTRVYGLNRADGKLFKPQEIKNAVINKMGKNNNLAASEHLSTYLNDK